MYQERVEWPGGTVTLETGRIARQADGAVVLRYRDSVILATAVAAPEARPGIDFFPLTVEYRERMSAAGRIPGAYGRREGRITDAEVLTSRLADRTIRPLFPEGYLNEVQVLLTVLSADAEAAPEGLAILAAAAALNISGIPWEGPVAGVRIARAWGDWHLFPSRAQRRAADLDLVVSAGFQGLVMVEGEAREAPESLILAALERGEKACRELCTALERFREAAGKPRPVFIPAGGDGRADRRVEEAGAAGLSVALSITEKQARRQALEDWRKTVVLSLAGEFPEGEAAVKDAAEALVRRFIRGRVAEQGRRLDGREPAAIRPIWGETGWLPRCHGSAIFSRGETQALVSCTLGTGRDEQRIETLEGETSLRFLLHYNFPPYSVGEIRPLRGPGRREIGHGNLAWRALHAVLPEEEEFPYTLRLVSDISESNGSSSMATVCGGCLALMDAGVPLRRPVAGIAMGLIQEQGRTAILSDILGDEDHLGDMDFKVAGTTEGITAIQMDNKLGAVAPELMAQALEQAREGRLQILQAMAGILPGPRAELSPSAPRIVSLRIRPERIRDVIGSGGRTIQEIQAVTGATIEVADDGLVRVYTKDAGAAAEATRRIRHLTLEPEVGKVYRGEVILVRDFFAIVRLGATLEGRLHVSELDHRRVDKVSSLLREGEEVTVRVLGVDKQGKIVLSRKSALTADESEIVN